MARSNLKQTWKILNELINRRNVKAPYPANFSKNGVKIRNPADIAYDFCDYFTNIRSNLSSKISPQILRLTISCIVLFLSPFRCNH